MVFRCIRGVLHNSYIIDSDTGERYNVTIKGCGRFERLWLLADFGGNRNGQKVWCVVRSVMLP